MIYQSVLKKMSSEASEPINYYLDMGADVINVNQLIGKKIEIELEHYQCMGCGKDVKPFRQGYCYECFFKTPLTGDWIMRPELSKAHLNIADRNLDYEKEIQLKPHIVYLANSSNVKVGVTRKSMIPTRWIDQGAHEALEILEVPNRYLAGIAEVALKDFVADKTNWRKMLSDTTEDENLIAWRDKLLKHLPEEVREYTLENNKETHLKFPMKQYPKKIKSLNLEKTPHYKGVLLGIKGQYLVFEDGMVLNIRNHEGIVVKLSV